MKCAGCQVGQHDYCARRDDVDLSALDDVARQREAQCDCDCVKRDVALMALTDQLPQRLEWPAGMQLADRLDALADQVALTPPKTPSERQEVGTALARALLAAREGETAQQVVRRVTVELGWAETMNAAESLGEWALALAVEAEKLKKAGR